MNLSETLQTLSGSINDLDYNNYTDSKNIERNLKRLYLERHDGYEIDRIIIKSRGESESCLTKHRGTQDDPIYTADPIYIDAYTFFSSLCDIYCTRAGRRKRLYADYCLAKIDEQLQNIKDIRKYSFISDPLVIEKFELREARILVTLLKATKLFYSLVHYYSLASKKVAGAQDEVKAIFDDLFLALTCKLSFDELIEKHCLSKDISDILDEYESYTV